MPLTSTHEFHGFREDSHIGGIIAAGRGAVLPRMPVWGLADALRRLPGDELELTLRSKLIPVVSLPGLKLFIACGEAALAMARHDGLTLIGTGEPADFIAAARRVHGPRLLQRAVSGLSRGTPEFSARRRLTGPQALGLAAILAVAALGALLLPLDVSWLLASLLAGLFFLSVIALRLLALLPPLRKPPRQHPPLSDTELPVYSILVPLFRETSVLDQLLNALTSLNYPPDKLDIKLILEETDIAMQRAVAALRLPPQFDVIVVPAGKPQTKPRALNYALNFARGTLLTIYDAEDVPEPMQLRQAAIAFAGLPPDVVCLQAQLVFYNPDENWLARQFTIEYATLFGLILPALAAHNLPLPLGGTSNHFRADALRQAGAWDPHNVTEDADLGLRLARLGFGTATFESRTFEEANVKLGNWMRQRARWLKGFFATWLVHMRDPPRLWKDLGPAGFWAAQAMTLGVFLSALLHPLCLVATVAIAILMPPSGGQAPLLLIACGGLNLLIFVAGYAVTMIAGHRALARLGIVGWWLPLVTMPVYWLLMSAAAWAALWQFIVAPFHWNKTEHGLSFVQRSKGTRPVRVSPEREINPYTD